MAIRTSEAEVRAIIETDANIDVYPMILHSNSMTDSVNTTAIANGVTLTAQELKTIETFIAAHLYAIRDPKPATEKSGRSSVKYQGKFGRGLGATYWGQMAMTFDRSGALASSAGADDAVGNTVVGINWLGTEET